MRRHAPRPPNTRRALRLATSAVRLRSDRPARRRRSSGRPVAHFDAGSVRSGGRALAAGDGGDDAHGRAVDDFGVQAVEEADVLVVDEHVDEPAQLALVVVEPLTEPGVRRLEAVEHGGEGPRLARDLGVAARELAQLRGDADGDRHAYFSSSSGGNASWKASRVGGITAVGPTVRSTASSVFRPCPVTYATTRSSERTMPSAASRFSVAMVTPPAVSAKIPSVRASSFIASTISSSVTAASPPPVWRTASSAK